MGYCVDHLTRLTVIGEQIADNCYCLSENYGPKQHNAQQPKSGITLVLFQDVMFDYTRWSSIDGSAVASVSCFMFLCQKVTFQCQNPVAFGFGSQHRCLHKDNEAWTKWWPFCRRRLKMYVLEWKRIHFESYFMEVCSHWQYIKIGSGNALEPNRPLPELKLILISGTIWRHRATISPNKSEWVPSNSKIPLWKYG